MITFTPMTTAGGNKGFYYYGARYYDPRVSVWLSVDPLASKYPYVTPYNFVENNPIRLVDPTGLGPDCPDCPKGSIDPVTVSAERLPLPGPVKEDRGRYFGPPAPPPSSGGNPEQKTGNDNDQNMKVDQGVAILIYGNGSGGTTPWTSGNDRRVIGSADANDPALSAAFGLAGKAKNYKGVNPLEGLASALSAMAKVLYGGDNKKPVVSVPSDSQPTKKVIFQVHYPNTTSDKKDWTFERNYEDSERVHNFLLKDTIFKKIKNVKVK